MFSWLKYRSSFISRKVRRQNMEWSKGVIFLMATFWPEGLWRAELETNKVRRQASKDVVPEKQYEYLPNHAISTLSYHILDLILIRDIEGDLPRIALLLAARHLVGTLHKGLLSTFYIFGVDEWRLLKAAASLKKESGIERVQVRGATELNLRWTALISTTNSGRQCRKGNHIR